MSTPDSSNPPAEKVRLTLTRNALERLLGGETETEVQLRQQVVEGFAGRHLKQLLNEPNFKTWADAHAKGLAEEVKRLVGTKIYSGGRYVAELQQQVRDLIWAAAEAECKAAAARFLPAVVAQVELDAAERVIRYEGRLMQEANDRVKAALRAVDEGLDRRLGEAFERRVEAECRRRLRRAAGMVEVDEPTDPYEGITEGH